MFYDCTIHANYDVQKLKNSKVIKSLRFNYNNVRAKMIRKKSNNNSIHDISFTENIDKVNPISRRTDDFNFSQK